jgi:hypothetical protein
MFRTLIIEALRNRFAGVSDAILGRVADKLAKTVTSEEQVATAVEGVTFQQVLESYGDSRANEAQQTAVRNYESKYGLKDGAKVENGGGSPQGQQQPTQQPTTGAEAIPVWAQALKDDNKALRDELTALKGERLATDRRQKLAAITGKLPETLRKAYDRTPVEGMTDDDFAALLTEVGTEVDGIVKDSNARGAVFGKPSAVNGRAAQGNELSKEQLDAISKREGVAAGDQQPF